MKSSTAASDGDRIPCRRTYSVRSVGVLLAIGALAAIGAITVYRQKPPTASQAVPEDMVESVEDAQDAVGDNTPKAELSFQEEERSDPEAEPNAAALAASRLDARRGDVPWSGLVPRPPTNEHERRLAEIPEYNVKTDVVFYSHIHKTSGTSLSILLSGIFRADSVLPSSHPSKGLSVDGLKGHDEEWWEPIEVMFSHNRPNITDTIGFPSTKQPRLLYTIRNPLLHKASIFFESVCRFGLHIKEGKIDVEEATLKRMEGNNMYSFCRDAREWLDSPMFFKVYRNMQSNWLSYGGAERHPCIMRNPELNVWGTGVAGGIDCAKLQKEGQDEKIWEEYFDRTADAAIRRMEKALWVGVTERMEESVCLLLLTLGKAWHPLGRSRWKEPRPITVWSKDAINRVAETDRADWKLFDAANDILNLRLWTARERLKGNDEQERERLGRCVDILLGD